MMVAARPCPAETWAFSCRPVVHMQEKPSVGRCFTSMSEGGLGSTKLTESTPAGQGFPSMRQPVPIIMPELKQRKHLGDLHCVSLEACIIRRSISEQTLPAKSHDSPVLLSAKTALKHSILTDCLVTTCAVYPGSLQNLQVHAL